MITDDQLRNNRAALEDSWAPDDSMELLWLRIRDIVAFGNAGDGAVDAINDGTFIRSTC